MCTVSILSLLTGVPSTPTVGTRKSFQNIFLGYILSSIYGLKDNRRRVGENGTYMFQYD
jgi:hypothetical protein